MLFQLIQATVVKQLMTQQVSAKPSTHPKTGFRVSSLLLLRVAKILGFGSNLKIHVVLFISSNASLVAIFFLCFLIQWLVQKPHQSGTSF